MQQVNLYVPELRPKKEWLTSSSLSVLVIAFFVLMSAGVVINHSQLKEYEQQVLSLELQLSSSSKQLADIKKKAPSDVAGKLDAEIVSLRERVNQRIQISSLIGSQSLGNQQGYASRLDELAESVPDDIGLTRFRFSHGARSVELLGESKKADRVADMVSGLKSKEGFNSATFGPLTVKEDVENNNKVIFSFGFEPVFDHEGLIAETKQ